MEERESYYQRVYRVVRQIPEGRVTSYGAIANFLGTGLSARMVGYAMNNSHAQWPTVPAHRVLNRNGLLTGKMHFGHPDRMQTLLEQEGILVEDDQVVDFRKHLWEPAQHLDPDHF